MGPPHCWCPRGRVAVWGLPLGCELLGTRPGVPRIPAPREDPEHRTSW